MVARRRLAELSSNWPESPELRFRTPLGNTGHPGPIWFESTAAHHRRQARPTILENPRWGDRRIQDELLKLGFRVSATTIRLLLRRRRIPPAPRCDGPTWNQFLRAQAGAVLACDFFTIATAFLGTLFVLVFLEIRSRRLLFASCTASPNSAWVTQQARNAAWKLGALESPIQLFIHDRDSKFVADFDAVLRAEGAKIALTPYRCPQPINVASV